MFILSISIVNISVSADMGPKPKITIDIKGIEGDYVAAFAATEAWGPNIDYEMWLEYSDEYDHFPEYNPIMEYKDEEGFKWITFYKICSDEDEIAFTYYRPEIFKLIIYKNGKLFEATEIIETYAFNSEFEIDFSNNKIVISNNYNYKAEVFDFFLRLFLTFGIEIGLFFVFRLFTKRNLIIVILMNLLTQVALNVIINLVTYYNGLLDALFIFYICEFFIFILEALIYSIFMKDKNKKRILIYAILANLASLITGIILL